jgi:hypothetical protein
MLAHSREPLTHDYPWFSSQVAPLMLDGPSARISLEEAITDISGEPDLRTLFSRRLA